MRTNVTGNVLNKIAHTPLEGCVRWVDFEETCNDCGTVHLFKRYFLKHESVTVPLTVGKMSTQKWICNKCDKRTWQTVTKVMPSEDQDD